MRGRSPSPARRVLLQPAIGAARAQRGAALLLAMLILTLVATLAAGMVWQQERSLRVEAAERARAQSLWILSGALDWARLILREDLRSARNQGQPPVDSLDEPWATPLAEARLSTFLAADRDNNVDSGPEAFISGAIVDAQARWNLRRLVDASGNIVLTEYAVLEALCNRANLPGGTAAQLAEGLRQAWGPPTAAAAAGQPSPAMPLPGFADVPLAPERLVDLSWLGVAPEALQRLAPWMDILPVPTPVNLNTAPREVLAAAVDGLDLGGAERLVQARQRKPFASIEEAKALLGETQMNDATRVSVSSAWFEVTGRLRLEDRAVEERSLLERRPNEVVVVRRERLNLVLGRPS
jgi:general secretion pathway protein K